MKRRLGVNVDHVATIRQARGTRYPDPVEAAFLAELAGAHQITIHLREDRRHIQERDLALLRQTVRTELNLEMAATDEMVALALKYKPHSATLVPEKRAELTTEGGLDAAGQQERLTQVCGKLAEAGVRVSLFIEAEPRQVAAAKAVGARAVEFHTGTWAEAFGGPQAATELARLARGCQQAEGLGLYVAAGHGLDYHNTPPVLTLPQIQELNIGHSLIARAMMVGLERAVKDMLALMQAGDL
jgi:pyridoxine 5-phosphate synthase